MPGVTLDQERKSVDMCTAYFKEREKYHKGDPGRAYIDLCDVFAGRLLAGYYLEMIGEKRIKTRGNERPFAPVR